MDRSIQRFTTGNSELSHDFPENIFQRPSLVGGRVWWVKSIFENPLPAEFAGWPSLVGALCSFILKKLSTKNIV